MRNILFLVMVFLLFNACKEGTKETKAPETSTVVPDTVSPENSILEGNYTDESYAKRSEGYDWVGVSIRTLDENSISVSVRSGRTRKDPPVHLTPMLTKKRGTSLGPSMMVTTFYSLFQKGLWKYPRRTNLSYPFSVMVGPVWPESTIK
ncbi:hypothetical protein NYZ99_19995 [Maribacter litopenaei]|uniref:Uncharacterized protein n=1 Tax=Maribacter litopenaei TaxID=2976127 RepID=A0ABY5Y7H1_9FLAO|nr:hypothetical protein [Maribacter litopenaei]UWX54970.1 hypothetical protein NYZ99_19995 [Maribacter litopenaei]